MASGRVGGTRSKVSGQIGSEIFRVVRNPDGTYTQIVSAKGEQTSTFTTPRLQAQRMVTAMVESMMKQLKPVGRISMQSGANKSKSLNAFSSFNLRLVAQDCKAHWYQDNQFVYPRHLRDNIDIYDLGGLYMISSGTLQGNGFDELYTETRGRQVLKDWPSNDIEFYGVKLKINSNVQTVGQFLFSHALTRLDTIVFVGFRTWLEQPDQEEEPIEHAEHNYLIATINPSVKDDELIQDEVLERLFIFETNYQPSFAIAKDNSFCAMGFAADIVTLTMQYHYWAAFTISYRDGRKKISSSSYRPIPPFTGQWLLYAAPTNVFGTWIGDPGNRHYPSPFEQT